ncbi:hypothetical protein MNV49_004393 [Pseudohyphozyma bogoriensis]|nr:hypothetical protein MNV49_004393 [Pseudohyphozyma bogoriensis]
MAPASVNGSTTTKPDVDSEKASSTNVGPGGEKHQVQPEVFGEGGVGGTKRGLTSRHLTFIGFGGGIGTGLFIGTGSALANAGPLGLLLAFTIVGAILWCVMESIGEMATLLPVAGTFPHFLTRTVDPAIGFTLALSYGDITPAVTISVGLFLIFLINIATVRVYGELEVITASIKVLCFLGLIVVALVITLGGAPNHQRVGFGYWNNPGALVQYNGIPGSKGQFLGFLSAFVNAAFSYIGIETVVIAAGETANPHRSIPKATKRVTYHILGAILIGMIVPYTNANLVSGSGNANSSPWVIAIKNAGIPALGSIVNACILTSAWSAGSSYTYVGARIIYAMALDKQAPKIFGKTNRWGVPVYAVLASFAFGPLAYLSLGSGGPSQAFSWLLNLSTVAGLLAWASLCYAFIRFYKACKVQAIDRSDFPYVGRFQPYSAWVGFIGSIVITLVQGFSVFLKGNWSTANFFASYVGILIFIVPAVGWKLIKKSKWVKLKDMDLWTGRFDSSKLEPEKVPTTWWGKVVDYLF